MYQYDIDFDFNGFKDNENQLITYNNVVITLKNGSCYTGSIKTVILMEAESFRMLYYAGHLKELLNMEL